jgi:hypothetical protein
MLRLGLPALAAGSLQLRPQRNTVFFKYLTISRMQSMCNGPLSDNAGFLEAEVSLSSIHGLTDDHMIQELDMKNPGSFIDPKGQPHISFAR